MQVATASLSKLPLVAWNTPGYLLLGSAICVSLSISRADYPKLGAHPLDLARVYQP